MRYPLEVEDGFFPLLTRHAGETVTVEAVVFLIRKAMIEYWPNLPTDLLLTFGDRESTYGLINALCPNPELNRLVRAAYCRAQDKADAAVTADALSA